MASKNENGDKPHEQCPPGCGCHEIKSIARSTAVNVMVDVKRNIKDPLVQQVLLYDIAVNLSAQMAVNYVMNGGKLSDFYAQIEKDIKKEVEQLTDTEKFRPVEITKG